MITTIEIHQLPPHRFMCQKNVSETVLRHNSIVTNNYCAYLDNLSKHSKNLFIRFHGTAVYIVLLQYLNCLLIIAYQ